MDPLGGLGLYRHDPQDLRSQLSRVPQDAPAQDMLSDGEGKVEDSRDIRGLNE